MKARSFLNAQGLKTLGVFILFFSFGARAAYVDDLIQKIDQIKLYQEDSWNKLLFSGSFNDPEFYRAGLKGRKDLRLEMQATLKALLQEELITIKGEALHAQCYYPARFEYLKQHLNIDLSKIPHPKCEKLEDYRKFASYTGVSLVFSSYFANNPASMFGHTLLRLHRSNKSGEPGLLDDAANFAAHIGQVHPLIYPIKGLMGYFPGRFALLPYSTKIQEYSNFDSRDLWEYELDFTAEESFKLALSLWEASYFWMSYYYLDENCSFMILALLEAARPSLNLTNQFNLYTIPSDTIKAAARIPGFVKSIQFKPSARSRYIERAGALSQTEQNLFLNILKKFKTNFDNDHFNKLLSSCNEECKIRVFDVLIEFIDFSEKKISTKKLIDYKDLRTAVLISRSKIAKPSPAFAYRPEPARPDRGPRSAMLELNSGFSSNGYNKSEFRWRPAHHDLSSSSLGYSDQLQIQILDLVMAYDDELKKGYVKRWVPLELTSLGKRELALSPPSWRVELGYSKDRNRKYANQLYDRSGLKIGFGRSYFNGPLGLFLMLQGGGGYSSDNELFWHFGVGPRLGFYWSLSDVMKFSTLLEWQKFYGKTAEIERRDYTVKLSYFWRIENEAYIEFRDQDFDLYSGLGYRFFY